MSTRFSTLLLDWQEETRIKLLELLESETIPAEGMGRESFGALVRLALMSGVRQEEFILRLNLSHVEAVMLQDGFLPRRAFPLPPTEERHADIVSWLRDVRLRESVSR